MRIVLDPEAPRGDLVHRVTQMLRGGALVVLPTDTVYAFACDVADKRAVERMRALRGLPRNKLFSLVCADLSDVGVWAGYLPPYAYRTLRRILPGPYTFILEAGDEVPKSMLGRRRTVGIRVPDNAIARAIARDLGRPLCCTSVVGDGDDPPGDPDELEDRFGGMVSAVIDGGVSTCEPSTVIDLTTDPPEVLRIGKGDVALFEGG